MTKEMYHVLCGTTNPEPSNHKIGTNALDTFSVTTPEGHFWSMYVEKGVRRVQIGTKKMAPSVGPGPHCTGAN